jgi:hypothetical protein
MSSIREMMRQRGAGGGGSPKLPRGSFGMGVIVIAGGLFIAGINASIFNGKILSLAVCHGIDIC